MANKKGPDNLIPGPGTARRKLLDNCWVIDMVDIHQMSFIDREPKIW